MERLKLNFELNKPTLNNHVYTTIENDQTRELIKNNLLFLHEGVIEDPDYSTILDSPIALVKDIIYKDDEIFIDVEFFKKPVYDVFNVTIYGIGIPNFNKDKKIIEISEFNLKGFFIYNMEDK
jgi:hypothetical protein